MATRPTIKYAGLPKERWDEIQQSLRDSSLTAEGYLERAFTYPEIEGVDLFRIAPKMSGRLDTFQPGFSPESVDSFVVDGYGPGRYSFRARVARQYISAQVFPIGDYLDLTNGHAPSAATTSRSTTPADELDPRQIQKDMLEEMQRDVQLGSYADRKADQEQNRLNRQLMPMMMMSMMKKLTADLTTPPAPVPAAADNAVIRLLEKQVDMLSAELRATREEMRNMSKPPTGSTTADAVAQVRLIADAASALGFTRGSTGPAKTDMWEGISKVAEVMGPRLDRTLDLITAKAGGIVPEPTVGPRPAGEPTSISGGGETVAGRVTERVDTTAQQAIALALEALRSRDFDTVLHVVTAILVRSDGKPLIVLNPKVNPIAYMIQLRPWIPTIDDYRAEFAEFLKWFGDKLEEAREEARLLAAAQAEEEDDGEGDDE